jgi:hypothetical protein
MRVVVHLDFVDLANPRLAGYQFNGRYTINVGDVDASVAVTAGEAQVIAEAWNRIADEIVERERGAA